MAKYYFQRNHRRIPRKLWLLALILFVAIIIGIVGVHRMYNHDLGPVSASSAQQHITIRSGSSVSDISKLLKDAGLIRSQQAFEWYISSHQYRSKLQAGTYTFTPSESTPDIAKAIVDGKVATDLVTIIPGQRLTQIREAFVRSGFEPASVDAALQIAQYRSSYPALADIPSSATLEGFLYPDSYQKTDQTDPHQIVEESLQEMQAHLTPARRSAFAAQGLTTFQGVTLASIVEQEVAKNADRAQVAQVFFKRLKIGMTLGSDVTAYYGSITAGAGKSLSYDSPYNTLKHKGLPPGPISSVSESSLDAVAHPAGTDWLYFVAGDDGNTYFSKTLADHQALTAKYCHQLCNESR